MKTAICNNFSFKLLKNTKILGECYTFVIVTRLGHENRHN